MDCFFVSVFSKPKSTFCFISDGSESIGFSFFGRVRHFVQHFRWILHIRWIWGYPSVFCFAERALIVNLIRGVPIKHIVLFHKGRTSKQKENNVHEFRDDRLTFHPMKADVQSTTAQIFLLMVHSSDVTSRVLSLYVQY